jgi:hypothetical protein
VDRERNLSALVPSICGQSKGMKLGVHLKRGGGCNSACLREHREAEGTSAGVFTKAGRVIRLNVSIIFYAPCLFMHHLLCVLFTLRGIFMHFLELTY